MRKSAVAFFGALLLSGCSVFGIRSGTEQAPYQVVERLSETVEIRRYPPLVVAETTVPATNGRGDRSEAFRRLFDYISGANQAREKVEMTAPVETVRGSEKIEMTVPVETAATKDGPYAMRFVLPASYSLETAPEPTDEKVRIREIPERLLAVLRFSGSTGTENVAEKRRTLARAIERSRWQVAGEPNAMFYDPPWTLPFLRRNEVAFPVSAD